MKSKILLIVLVSLFTFSGIALGQKKQNTKKTVVFDVSMTCENCKKRIEKNIAYEKGVTDMQVNLPDKTVEIEYKSDKTDSDKLKASIEKLGYTVTEHKNEE